jgi:hypothetical protein
MRNSATSSTRQPGQGVIVAAAAIGLIAASLSVAARSSASPLASPSASAPAARVDGVPRASHVFVIVGENTSLSDLTRHKAPYLAGQLKPKAAWLRGYRAVPHSSSTGNYIEMTSGQSIKCERNDANPVNPNTDKSICHQNVNNVFHQLQAKHISWKDWQQSMPHPCAFYDDGTNWAGDVYGAHHNPAIYYDNIEGNRYVEDYNKAPKQVCIHHDVPMGTTAKNDTSAFDRALRKGTVPRFNYIVPNDCENGHDVCTPTNNSVGQFDSFAKREVAKIIASPAWDSRSVINITWDEQGDLTPHNRQVGSIWYGAQVKPEVYNGSWGHASLLRTVEDEFGLAQLRGARTAAATTTIWR